MVEMTKQKELLFGLGGWTMPPLNPSQSRSKPLRLADIQFTHSTEIIIVLNSGPIEGIDACIDILLWLQ